MSKIDAPVEDTAVESSAIAEVRNRLPNAPDDEWVKKHCPVEVQFAERMLVAEARTRELEKRLAEAEEVIKQALASAYPTATGHPKMWAAWGEMQAFLSQGSEKTK